MSDSNNSLQEQALATQRLWGKIMKIFCVVYTIAAIGLFFYVMTSLV